jgi:ElaB/YqjD/DUF883 family membrane-anchored ribosome-binding protein
MDDEVAIRQKMEAARDSLTEKLETLEDTMVDTVQQVAEPVSETARAVKETVESVKESVEVTAEAVKETVQEGVQTVRHWFDVTGHVRKHPWLMMAGAVGAGMCMDLLLRRPAPPMPAAPTHNGHGRNRDKRASAWSGKSWFAEFGPEIAKLKNLAMNALIGTVRHMVLQAAPQPLQNGLREIIDGVARKLGGEPPTEMDQPQSPATETKGERHGNGHSKRNQTEMGRPMGPTRRSS